MADRYVRAAGGNWSAAATWASTSGGTETVLVPTAADAVIMDAASGQLTLDAAGTCLTFTQAVGTTAVFTNSGFTLTVAGNVTLLADKYVASADTSAFSITAAATFTSGGTAQGNLTFNKSAGALTLGDNWTGRAGKTVTLSITAGSVNLNGKTLAGNSAINRLFLRSTTVGTAMTVTTSTALSALANVDVQDIAFTNGADLDLSAITGLSGDCGGNTLAGGYTLTFTTPRTSTFAGVSGSWSDVTKWTTTGATDRVPLPQDTAVCQAMSAGQTITVDMPRLPATSFAAATNTPAVTFANAWSIYGSLNLTGAGTVTHNNFTTSLAARSNSTLTTAGKTLRQILTVCPGCTYTLGSALTLSAIFYVAYGSINTAGYSLTAASVSYTTGVSASSQITLGLSTVTLTGSGDIWAPASATVSAASSTIAVTYTGASASTFFAGANAYNAIQITPGSGVLTFSGAFSVASISMSAPGGKLINWAHSTTYTLTGSTFLSGSADGAAIISPTLLNGGFETAGGGGADVFANWGEGLSGASTVNDDTSTVYAGTHACRIDVDGSNSAVSVTQVVLTAGTVYKATLYARADSGTPTIAVGTISNPISVTLSSTYTAYTVYFVADVVTFRIGRINAAGRSLYIDNVTLTPVNNVVLQSTSAGTQFTLSKSSGIVEADYLSLKDSAAGGGAIWLAGNNSTSVSGNTGWHFNALAIPGAATFGVSATATAYALAHGVPGAAGVAIASPVVTAKTLCNAVPGDATYSVTASMSAIIASWSASLFKAARRDVALHFPASHKRST